MKALLLLAALAVAGVTSSQAADVTTPIVSGLPWRSGAQGEAAFGDWRGRPLDVRGLYPAYGTWAALLKDTSGRYFRERCDRHPLCVVSLPMLPKTAVGQFRACAGGSFDANYRQIATNIAASRTEGVAIRIGWEANGPAHRPWHIRSLADVAPYKACWRRIAGIMEQASPDFLMDWSNAKKGSLPFNVMETYPGDDVVDIISAQYHDGWPRKNTQAAWDRGANMTQHGGPAGINKWLEAARSKGKQFAVPEWAVWADGSAGDPDNPFYVASMFRFFRENAADIAYASYHNMGSQHMLYATTQFPKAHAEYLRQVR